MAMFKAFLERVAVATGEKNDVVHELKDAF